MSTVACVAPGGSLTRETCDRLAGRCRVMVCNNAYELAPFAELLYACDYPWWREHIDHVRQCFHGELWSQDAQAHERFGVNHIPLAPVARRNEGLSTDPSCIHAGYNSGYQLINLALHRGATRILLVGYDMHGDHFFGEYSHPELRRYQRNFAKWIRAYQTIEPAKYGIEIINCTPASALRCFPTMDLDDGLQGLPAAA